MWRLLIVLVFLVASVLLGLEVIRHPGYVLIMYQPWMVQMPLWFALLCALILIGLLYIVITSVDRVQFLLFRIKNWLRFRREHKAYSKTQHGMALLTEGRWKKAEKWLLAGVNDSLDPLINYLGAAKAAQEQGVIDRRDEYIQKAHLAAPYAELAIALTQAELQIQQNQLEQAAATLNHLRQLSPRHPRVLKLLEKVYVHLGDWKNLQTMLPAMRKAKILTREQAEQFDKNIYCELLREAKNKSPMEWSELWNSMPRAARNNSDVVCEYVKLLSQRPDNHAVTEELIRKTLKHAWQPDLVRIYCSLPFSNLQRQLVIAGAWLKMYGQQPELLLLLGKLCEQSQLWGKAKDYYEKCLALGPNAEASLAYGLLLENLDEPEEAMRKYRDGLKNIECASIPRN